jgi:uncharacterized membrane protein YhaH (DUF805 family)
MGTYRGRINRASYWLTLGGVVLILAVLRIAGAKHIAVSEVVLIFVCVPRLHDIGKSGWFVLIGIFVELASLIIGLSFFTRAEVPAIFGVAGIIIIGLLIWLGTIRGELNVNQWGEPPAPGLSFKRRSQASNQ